jgi:hypothetical protein
MPEPVELSRDEFSTYFRDDQRSLIEQRWSSAPMSEQQFRERIAMLAQFLERAHVQNVLVDMSKIEHTPSEDFNPWRQAHIIPRYNAAGVKKFAFILPPGAPDTVENGTTPAVEGAAKFPTGYFASRDQALKWFET